MAQLKSSVVQGSLRVTDTTYTNELNLASAAASKIVKTDANKNLIAEALEASEIPALDASKITGGTFAAARLPKATTSAIGAVKIGTNISVSDGTISVASGSTSTTGIVKLDSATGSGETTAVTPKGAAAAATAAVNALDGNLNSTSPGAGKTLTAFSQTNGKVSATFGDIAIGAGQITSGTLSVAHGGTGIATATHKNAIIAGNASTATDAFQAIRTNDGAFFATGQDATPSFGTLPVAQGGTGITIINPHNVFVGPASGTTAAAPTWRTLNYQDSHGIEYIRGTWTAASGTWTGTTTDHELYDGKQIILYMPFAGSGNATLNLTLADGKTTGAKNVYFESTTRFTTHKGQNSQLHLIYHKALTLSNGTTYEGWWYVANRDTDNDYRARQNLLADTDTADRSLLLSNPAKGTANNNTAYVSYRNNQFYVNASTGTLFSPNASFTDTTASTSTTTGAVKIAGGLGVVGQVTATRVGAGGSNTGYTLYANGTTFLNGKVFSGTSNYGAALPTSGQTGQIFFQINNDTYELPLEGNVGQFLIKNATNVRDVVWGNTISSLIVTGTIVTHGTITAQKVFNAVWNDYAECRNSWVEEPGRVIVESKSGTMELATEHLMAGCKIISDTYGNLMGQSKTARTPIAVAGRVLAYPYQAREKYELGAAVCSGPNGTVDIMTREEIKEYPERILGTVSEIPDYDVWHAGDEQNPIPIQVNGRIWIYVR